MDCKSRPPAEYILGRIDSWSNLRWPRAAYLIKVKSSQVIFRNRTTKFISIPYNTIEIFSPFRVFFLCYFVSDEHNISSSCEFDHRQNIFWSDNSSYFQRFFQFCRKYSHTFPLPSFFIYHILFEFFASFASIHRCSPTECDFTPFAADNHL